MTTFFPPCFEEIPPCHPQTPRPVYPKSVTLFGFLSYWFFPSCVSFFFHIVPRSKHSLFIFIIFVTMLLLPFLPLSLIPQLVSFLFLVLVFTTHSLSPSISPLLSPAFGVCNVISLCSKVSLFSFLLTGSVIALGFTY